MDDLQRLVRFIKPTTEGRYPVRYDFASCNYLALHYTPSLIGTKLLSSRLPVDSVDLWIKDEEVQEAAEEFLKSAGPLYYVRCGVLGLKQSTVDTLIDKFVPVDEGCFYMGGATRLTRAQLEKLVLKCEFSEKKAALALHLEGVTDSSKVTDFFDFEKYYGKKEVQEGELAATRGGQSWNCV
uniref:GCV_T domain-containing protein n=1 Tax=Steinernema glaseri TaxID=37863 RepID=A0A1I7YH97_9BILA